MCGLGFQSSPIQGSIHPSILDFSRLGDCLRQELLNGIHHVSRLIEKSVTGLCDPFKV